MKISLAMIVKNGQLTIERCLESVKDLVDEIVIVDTGSTDNTIDIIKSYPNVVLHHFSWCDDFSKARNYSIEKTTGEYLLVLDSDEYIIDGTRAELELVMSCQSIGQILIHSDFKKDNQIYQSNVYVSRFFPKEVRYVGAIHEQLASNMPRVKLNIRVKHDGYFETNKSKRNIPLLIAEVKGNPTDPYYLFQLGKELRIDERFEEAFHFLKKSYEVINDSAPYYAEVIVELINSGKECGKVELIEVIRENNEILNNVSDFHFAKGLFYLDYCLKNPHKASNFIQRIERSFLTCLSLNNKAHTEYVQGTSSYLAAYNLGVFYEVTGNFKEAREYYELASKCDYELAINRLKFLTIKLKEGQDEL